MFLASHLFFFVYILFKPENMKLATASSFLSLWKTVLQEAVTHELLSFQDILPIEIFFPIVLLFFFFLILGFYPADQETVNIPDFQIIK